MTAYPQASIPSCDHGSGSGRAARGIHAAILVYPAPPGADHSVLNTLHLAASRQARALQRALPRGWRISAVVQNCNESVQRTIRAANALSPRRLVVVSMDPWRVNRPDLLRLKEFATDVPLELRDDWGDESSLIDLHARAIRAEAIAGGFLPENSTLVLRARSALPDRLRRTADLIAARTGWHRERVALDTQDPREVQQPVCENQLVHALDLFSIQTTDHPCRNLSEACPDKTVAVLSALIRRGRYPMGDSPPALYSWPRVGAGFRTGVSPIARAGAPRPSSARLVMLGVSVEGALGRGEGPRLQYCDAATFRALKRPHLEVLDVLSSLRGGMFSETMVWNTCNRLELYGWVAADADEPQVRRTAASAAAALFGDAAGEINLLFGRCALQHLFRTAAGLNSTLAGDAEILDQLESARRTAEHAGTAGERTCALVRAAADVVFQLREQTLWADFAHRYCEVALDRLRSQLHGAAKGRCVVVGGSTTGASVLETLSERIGARPANLTLVYRGQRSGTLTRRLHAAAAEGRIVNIETYADPAVMTEIAGADAVFLTGDHREPVLCAHELTRRRDVAARPLLVVDFNTLGSTQNLERLEGVRLITAEQIDGHVKAFNREVVSLECFRAALQAAEECISQHADAHMGIAAPGWHHQETTA